MMTQSELSTQVVADLLTLARRLRTSAAGLHEAGEWVHDRGLAQLLHEAGDDRHTMADDLEHMLSRIDAEAVEEHRRHTQTLLPRWWSHLENEPGARYHRDRILIASHRETQQLLEIWEQACEDTTLQTSKVGEMLTRQRDELALENEQLASLCHPLEQRRTA